MKGEGIVCALPESKINEPTLNIFSKTPLTCIEIISVFLFWKVMQRILWLSLISCKYMLCFGARKRLNKTLSIKLHNNDLHLMCGSKCYFPISIQILLWSQCYYFFQLFLKILSVREICPRITRQLIKTNVYNVKI